jgi:flagellar motility protein MotE (MotC chaperone)
MKKLLLIGVTALLLFSISAAVSWYLRQSKLAAGEPEGGAEDSPAAHSDSLAKTRSRASGSTALAEEPAKRVAVKPPSTEGVVEAVQLATSLRDRQASLRERENQLAMRQKQLELVYKDIRGERSAIDELRKQISDELKALKEQMGVVEQQHTELDQERQKVSQEMTDWQKNKVELEGAEWKNIDKMAKLYGSMPPENAAQILKRLADTGRMDTAVKLLGQMQERQAAKVLAELPEPDLAAQLLEKLRGLKRPAPTPKP